ncbi:MAG TPA: hypothetical protein VD997_02625 [Phycisphaerales bacterium]|nr:hypothetical protein [Phycisphaerales bacterium]
MPILILDVPPPTLNPRPLLPALTLAAFTLALGLALILSSRIPSRVAYDQKLYHEPTIRQFARQWPDFDLWHYKSATTPGYHILEAAVARFISPSITALQLVSLLIATTLSFLLGHAAGRRAPPLLAIAITLPFACSVYVVQSSAWLLPDDLGWLGVLAILLIALRPRLTLAWLTLGGLILLALVLVRQIHAWTAGLLWVAAWLTPSSQEATADPTTDPLIPLKLVFTDVPRQLTRTLLAVAFTVPALAILALFARYWQGLVPPVFQGWYKGANPAAFVMILATFGAFSPFFAPLWWPHALRLWRTQRTTLLVILALIFVAACIVPTNHDYEAGRRSGLWNIAAKLPLIAGHTSPFMLALSMLGALAILALAAANDPRRRLILIAAILGYTAASTANHDLFQRYVDPFALMLFALLSSGGTGLPTGVPFNRLLHYLRPLTPLALSLALLAVTLNSLRHSDHINDPPPAANLPHEPPAPANLPRPPEPPNHRFWPL